MENVNGDDTADEMVFARCMTSEQHHGGQRDDGAAAATAAPTAGAVATGGSKTSGTRKKTVPKKMKGSGVSQHGNTVNTTNTSSSNATGSPGLKHKRRYCKMPGCERIVKSQGLCQRHGAQPCRCKIPSCNKQAQGNSNGMCKSHFKIYNPAATTTTTTTTSCPLPQKIAHRRQSTLARLLPPPPIPQPEPGKEMTEIAAPLVPPQQSHQLPWGTSVYDKVIPESLAWDESGGTLMPMLAHLKQGYDAVKPAAWHRNEEHAARGMRPVRNPAAELETWERELVMTEILLLTGHAPDESFGPSLAHGWGRREGFHKELAELICRHRGDAACTTSSVSKENERNQDAATETEMDDCMEEEIEEAIFSPLGNQMMCSDQPDQASGADEATTLDFSAYTVPNANDPNNEDFNYNTLNDVTFGEKAYNEALEADMNNLSDSCQDDFGNSVDPVKSTSCLPAQSVSQLLPSPTQLQQLRLHHSYPSHIEPHLRSKVKHDDDCFE